MVSYAQNGEDIVLSRIFKENKGFYVDIGAAFPTLDSVTKHFYDLGWTGINVEPIPKVFEILENNRKNDINLNCAVGSSEGFADMVIFPEVIQCSSINSNFSDFHGVRKETIKVEVKSLDSILEEYAKGKDIDFLKIDVEGNEGDVLNSVDLKKWKPKVIIIEVITHGINADTNKEWEKKIIDSGYTFSLYDGINKFFVREDLEEINKLISVPVNILDNYYPVRFLTMVPLEVREQKYKALREKGKSRIEDVQSFELFEKSVLQLQKEKDFKYE